MSGGNRRPARPVDGSARHLDIDGSGMLQAALSTPVRVQLGSRFSSHMRQARVPYRVENVVTEYVEDRLLARRPWGASPDVGSPEASRGVTN